MRAVLVLALLPACSRGQPVRADPVTSVAHDASSPAARISKQVATKAVLQLRAHGVLPAPMGVMDARTDGCGSSDAYCLYVFDVGFDRPDGFEHSETCSVDAYGGDIRCDNELIGTVSMDGAVSSLDASVR